MSYVSPIQTESMSSHSRQSSINTIRTPASPFDPLAAALATAQARYTLANQLSLKAHNDACEDLPGGNTRTVLHSSPFPITFVKGKGCELRSKDGDDYVDFLGEFTAGLFGHSNPKIATAITEALASGWNYGGPNNFERELARKVTTRFSPSGIELVRFTNSGTEANTMAIATAVAFTRRKNILVFRNGYHGGTLYFSSTLSEINTNLPHQFVIAPYNNIKGTQSIISKIPVDSLAAILVEPIQGSAGCVVGDPKFLHYLNNTAHELGALFIVDEVMTSRLSYNGLSAALDLTPDLVTLGKWVGGGMTFGAFGGRKDGPMDMFDPRKGALSHSGTFNNNVITMAAGCAGIEIYTDAEIQRLNGLGRKLKTGVESILSKSDISGTQSKDSGALQIDLESLSNGPSPLIIEPEGFDFESLTLSDEKSGMWISGQGSMLCMHFSGESKNTLVALFWHHLIENGIYIAQRGFIALNLELKDDHIETFLKIFEEFVLKYERVLRSSKG